MYDDVSRRNASRKGSFLVDDDDDVKQHDILACECVCDNEVCVCIFPRVRRRRRRQIRVKCAVDIS